MSPPPVSVQCTLGDGRSLAVADNPKGEPTLYILENIDGQCRKRRWTELGPANQETKRRLIDGLERLNPHFR